VRPSSTAHAGPDGRRTEQRVSLYTLPGKPLFFQRLDDPLTPHLRLVHQYPRCFPRVRIDRGAIRFVLSGATLMVPGLTSPGGRLPSADAAGEDAADYGTGDLAVGSVVVVEAEGKENACLVGVLKMSTKDMKEKKKGIAMDDGHFVGDGLWKLHLD
jgi:malignant T-cell-amplified sequence